MNSLREGQSNELASLDDIRGSDFPVSFDDRTVQKTSSSDDSIFDFGDIPENLDFSDFCREEGIFGASEIDVTSFDAALRDIQKPGKGIGRKQALTSYSEDDFEDGAARKAFILIRYYKNAIFKKDAKINEIINAATFVFGRTVVGEMNFDMCCEVLNARRDVLRMRFHYEFFLRFTVFAHELPFMIDPLPKIIENEILMYINEGARALAYEAWVQPGITQAKMFERSRVSLGNKVTDEQMNKWLQSMEERYLMSQAANHWYLTGRNPLMRRIESMHSLSNEQRGGTLNWSKQW